MLLATCLTRHRNKSTRRFREHSPLAPREILDNVAECNGAHVGNFPANVAKHFVLFYETLVVEEEESGV